MAWSFRTLWTPTSITRPARAGDLGYSPAWPPQSSWQESYCRLSISLFAGLRVEAIPSMSWCARGPVFYLTRRLYEQRWVLGQPLPQRLTVTVECPTKRCKNMVSGKMTLGIVHCNFPTRQAPIGRGDCRSSTAGYLPDCRSLLSRRSHRGYRPSSRCRPQPDAPCSGSRGTCTPPLSEWCTLAPSSGPLRAQSACSKAVSTTSVCSERETCQLTMARE